jgi:hypothetical protein
VNDLPLEVSLTVMAKRDSVYFMAKNDIIGGLGNNIFGPAPVEGKDANYSKATREQAFKIAVAMIEKFK